MIKIKRIGIVLLIMGICIFVSCSHMHNLNKNASSESDTKKQENNISSSSSMPYGPYLAGRTAHIRKDFNSAADYYIKALKNDPDNQKLIGQLYLLLVSQNRVDEAATYAKQHLNKVNKDNFAHTVIAVWQMHHNMFEESIKTISKYDNPAYKSFIAPLLKAWNYVGLNQQQNALNSLESLKKENGLKGIYYFHAGMINDYFDDHEQAKKHYETLITEETSELSLRSLQIISNFYMRHNQKEKAISLVSKINNDKLINDILGKYSQQAQLPAPQKLISTPQKGSAEALFSIAATFRYDSIIDVAHMFTSLAIYQNPDYDLAKMLLADILEDREIFDAANNVYQSIPQNSPMYYTAQIKYTKNLIKQNDYDTAELVLKSLALDFNNPQLYIDLGDVLRLKSAHPEAIKYYQKALSLTPQNNSSWVIYYALGIAYEQNGDWKKAEASFLKAKELSNNHYLVLNYLGYTWLSQKQNITDAFMMIAQAYKQSPNDVNITDSLGWALYKLGYYGMATKYLEEAAEDAPENPIIRNHLGDVYWHTNRQNEARFQWQQALDLKDKNDEINRKLIEDKIKNGISQTPKVEFDQKIVSETISSLSKYK
ncbi:MAG: tetratricopeptide repeat protein [Alphaproteobacteria bacterium]|nr:tetratricopeptide repeat protein [Alphaproteobacteria bacterium]